MGDSEDRRVARALLARHGRTLAEEAGIRLGRGTPSPLHRLLCACVLTSAPISAGLAVAGARALAEAGWTTAARMSGSRWADRPRVLNRSGYAAMTSAPPPCWATAPICCSSTTAAIYVAFVRRPSATRPGSACC